MCASVASGIYLFYSLNCLNNFLISTLICGLLDENNTFNSITYISSILCCIFDLNYAGAVRKPFYIVPIHRWWLHYWQLLAHAQHTISETYKVFSYSDELPLCTTIYWFLNLWNLKAQQRWVIHKISIFRNSVKFQNFNFSQPKHTFKSIEIHRLIQSQKHIFGGWKIWKIRRTTESWRAPYSGNRLKSSSTFTQ